MIITHRKDLLLGDYLIDDREANGAKDFKGELISFGWAYEKNQWNEYPTWDDVLKQLLKKQ
jgi:5'-nucleotidase